MARRYAKSLVELCAESKNHAVIGKQLESFAQTWAASADLQELMRNPVVPLADKREVLTKIIARFLFAPTTRNFLLVLLDNGRIAEVESIARAFAEQMDAIANRVRATVTSAVPMERADMLRIQTALQRLTGKTVLLDAKVDPALIGGVVTEIGNVVLDGSVRTQLETLHERLLA